MQSLLKPCWILLAFIISVPSVSSQDVCYNQWSIGPSEANRRNCNILGGSTDLVSRCGVTRGNSNVTVEWYFSSLPEEVGKNGDLLGSSMDQHFSVKMICFPSVCVAELTIYNVSISDVGYYWCKIAEPITGGSMQNIRNPSSVLNISGSCEELYPCTESSIATRSLNNLGCAYGEVAANSLKIVHLQNASECDGDVIATSNDIQEITTAITPNNPATTLLPDRPTNETMTEPPNTQQTSDGPAATVMTTSDQIPFTTEQTRQTGPTADGNATPDVTSRAITPAAVTEDDSGDGEGTDDATGGRDSSAGLPQHVVWSIVGVGISILLLIIAILVCLIVCLQCIKRKTKDKTNVACVNRGYMVEEVELIHTRSTELTIEKDPTRDHLYSEIPSNFTLTASSNEHSPSQPAAHSVSAKIILCSRQYKDVDLEPMNQNNATSSRHQYETMVNNDYDECNSILHSENWSHNNQSLSTSLSRTSGSPLLNCTDKESVVFDNPKYNSNSKHINIYRSESSDSSYNSEQTRHQWLPRTLHTESHKEHLHDSSHFSVSDRFEDHSKLPISPTGIPPASHYTHVLPNASKESAYAHPIKSTGDQYVSEHGHIYVMLEGATAPDAGKEKKVPATYSRVIPKRERADNKLVQIEEAYSLRDNVTTYCSLPDTEDSSVSGSDYDVIGREHPRATRHTSTSDDSGYDVIERGEMKFPPKNVGVEAQYNVTDRQRVPREQSSSPQDKYGDYDVIDRTNTPSNMRTNKMTVLNKNSCNPLYSSLELYGNRGKTNANDPFYDALNLEKSQDKQEVFQCKKKQGFYHTVEPEEQNIFAIP